ncbi:MAG: hypothetical protein AAF512_14510, partial [Pseudomonadota bacterium]
AKIAVGSIVQVSFDGAQPSVEATVMARDAAVNVRSRNLRLRAQLPAATVDLLPGMLVQVAVPLGSAQSATVVPATAVRRDALGASVYVLEPVEENGRQKTRARRRKIELAALRGTDLDTQKSSELVVVANGLEPGEEIAAIGAFKLRDGSLAAPSEPDLEIANRVVGR